MSQTVTVHSPKRAGETLLHWTGRKLGFICEGCTCSKSGNQGGRYSCTNAASKHHDGGGTHNPPENNNNNPQHSGTGGTF